MPAPIDADVVTLRWGCDRPGDPDCFEHNEHVFVKRGPFLRGGETPENGRAPNGGTPFDRAIGDREAGRVHAKLTGARAGEGQEEGRWSTEEGW